MSVGLVRLAAGGLALLAVLPSLAGAAVPRPAPGVAEVVTVKGDEEMRFVEEPAWRSAEIAQAVVTGDAFRTGPYGGLALLFRDATQIRVQRNSHLVVRAARAPDGSGQTLLRLESGAAWSRARARPEGLRIETPVVTSAIRGTDWHLRVEDDGRTTLIVLAGEVELFNQFGAVTVARGEIGIVEPGRAPVKLRFTPSDRRQWELVVAPDWLGVLPVTGRTPGALRVARRPVEHLLAAPTPASVLLEQAEIAYELYEPADARRLLEEAERRGGVAAGRVMLLRGLLAGREARLADAERALTGALADLAGRPRLVAQLGRWSILLARRQYAAAEAGLAELAREWGDAPEVVLAAVQLTSLRGDQPRAIETAREGERRFPGDLRFGLWLAHLHLFHDDAPRAREALDAVLARDAEQPLAWHLRGIVHQLVDHDVESALRAYRQALALLPGFAPAWNSLSIIHVERGEFAESLAAIRTAIRLAPHDPLYRVFHALVLWELDRLDEAEAEVREALALDPARADALFMSGMVDLKRGRIDQAVDAMLRSTVADPGLVAATTRLGIAYHQAEDFAGADQAIDNALRLGPNDYLPALTGSIMAIDRFEAGRGIRLAREALDRYRRAPTYAAEDLAKSQSGILNLGSAYTNLGLADWGEYQGQSWFNPFWSASHFFAASLYPPEARRASIVQGLLLAPQAVASRSRYFDFTPRPFHDLTLGASVGSEGGALRHGQFAILQGLVRVPAAVSYVAAYRRERDEGFRTNSAVTRESGEIGLGTRLDGRHDLLLAVAGARERTGVPGPEDAPDPDDSAAVELVRGELGYHYRAGAASHVLARLSAGYRHTRIRNPASFGAGLSDRTVSLVERFGLEQTRGFYAAGVCDATLNFPPPGLPKFLLGADCPFLGLPLIPSDIPAGLDVKTLRTLDAEEPYALVQGAHLLGLGPVRLWYGAEWSPSWLDVTARSTVFAPTGSAIAGSALAGTAVLIPFGSRPVATERARFARHAASAWVDADWEATRTLRLEAGLFFRHWDDDDRAPTSRPDPRGGLAWQPAPGHWLRVAGRRDLVLPIDGTLSPVATVGLVPPEAFTVEGGSTTTYTARWDAEWLGRAHTFVAAEQQRIRRFSAPIPLSLDSLTVSTGVVRSLTAGAGAWLGEGWGVFARQRWAWSENQSRGPDRGRDLPLVPERTFDAGVTWVHPSHVRASAAVAWVGERAGDTANRIRLEEFWTAGAAVTWQPLGKRWSFTLAGQNLLDRDFDLAPGAPAPGLGVTFSAEYRF